MDTQTENQVATHAKKTPTQFGLKAASMEEKDRSLVSRENRRTVGQITVDNARMSCRNVNVYYGEKHAIKNVSLDIGRNEVIAMIGPSGCGKSTFIRCLNRMNDTIDSCRVTGEISLDGQNIYAKNVDVVPLRAQVGMVFQKPNPFPKSIYDNIAYGPKIHGLAGNKAELDHIVETSLKKAGLWNEVHDILDHPGTGLSGGQQQRLCIARTIAVSPELILMQASRVSQRTAYFHLGDLIEVGRTERLFTNPRHQLTEDYITGRFG